MGNSKPHYLHTLEVDKEAVAALHEAGCLTIFDICRHTELTFIEKVPTLPSELAKQLYARAQQRSQCLLSLYRAYQARNEPLMRRIAKLGIASAPVALGQALERSLGGAPDFADLFPERSDDGYADAESIQSLFAPGRYLVELYKIAEGLHTANSPLNLNARRPDIAALVLNEENLTQEVSTLDILIDVLQQGIQSSTGVSMTQMERIYYPMTLPYHDNLVQIRSVLSFKSSSLQQVWAVLADYQAQQFQPIPPSSTSLRENIQTPAPAAREEILLTPATFELLAAPPASAEVIQDHYHLPTANIAEELRPSSVFLDRTGLTFNQLLAMTGQADYETSDPVALRTSRFYKYGSTTAVPVANYGQFYLACHGNPGPTPLLLGPGIAEPELQLAGEHAEALADRAERLIRLQPLVQLEFHQLDWLIRNANEGYRPGHWPVLSQPILEAIAEFMRLRDTYSLSSDAFACFVGSMNTYAPKYQISLYEKLFTSPTEGNTLPLNVTLNFDPAVPSDERALLCGGLGVSPDELFVMAKLAFTDTSAVIMDPNKFARLYRQAMIPQMLGISFDQARLLWRMLNPKRDIAALVAGPATLEVLDVIRQTETVLQWLRDHEMSLEEAFSLVTDNYSSNVTPELFNFTNNIYTSLSSDPTAETYQPSAPLPDSLRQKLFRLNASVFKVKANVMGRLIDWLDQHFTSKANALSKGDIPYGLGSFWSDIGSLFGPQEMNPQLQEETSDVARYSHAMAQYALIALWANLTEQDLTLIVDTPAWFMGDGGETVAVAPPPSLEVLLFISRLKEWQQRVIVPEAEAMTYFALANRAEQTAEVALAALAYLQGWDRQATEDMNANLVQEQRYTDFPKSFAQVLQLEAWMQVGQQAGVGSQSVQGLYRMSLERAEAEDSTLIQGVAEALVASLQN